MSDQRSRLKVRPAGCCLVREGASFQRSTYCDPAVSGEFTPPSQSARFVVEIDNSVRVQSGGREDIVAKAPPKRRTLARRIADDDG